MYRQVGSFTFLEDLWSDLRYALRTLRKSPAYTTTAAATLALAIGSNTAMFSVLNAVLLRPLPYRSPEQLAMLWTERSDSGRPRGQVGTVGCRTVAESDSELRRDGHFRFRIHGADRR